MGCGFGRIKNGVSKEDAYITGTNLVTLPVTIAPISFAAFTGAKPSGYQAG